MTVSSRRREAEVEAEGIAHLLLQQHGVLRGLIFDLVEAARVMARDGMSAMASCATRLLEALVAHEGLEETLCEPFLRSQERRSSLRVSEMLSAHHRQYESFLSELQRLAGAKAASAELEEQVFELAAAVYAHMDRAEIDYSNARRVRE